jgi:hypothetical protein
MTRQGVLLLWPLKLPTDGPGRSWAETARQAAELAKTKWARVVPDMGLDGYRIFMAEGSLPEPEWPDKPLDEILQIAFGQATVRPISRGQAHGRADTPLNPQQLRSDSPQWDPGDKPARFGCGMDLCQMGDVVPHDRQP